MPCLQRCSQKNSGRHAGEKWNEVLLAAVWGYSTLSCTMHQLQHTFKWPNRQFSTNIVIGSYVIGYFFTDMIFLHSNIAHDSTTCFFIKCTLIERLRSPKNTNQFSDGRNKSVTWVWGLWYWCIFRLFACMSNIICDLEFQEYSLDTINRQTVTVIPDSMFRVQIQSCECEAQQASIINTFFSSQISSQLDSLFLLCNTIFKFDRL